MTPRVAATLLFLVIGTSAAFGAEQITQDALMEKTRHWKEPKVAIWYYIGSEDGRDFFLHYDLGVSEAYSVATGQIPLPKMFPHTKKRKDWIVMKWGPFTLPHSTSNQTMQRTATRCAATFSMTKTFPLRLALAAGSRR
jgi:hypothetical protein